MSGTPLTPRESNEARDRFASVLYLRLLDERLGMSDEQVLYVAELCALLVEETVRTMQAAARPEGPAQETT